MTLSITAFRSVPCLVILIACQSATSAEREVEAVKFCKIEKLEEIQGVWDSTGGTLAFAGMRLAIDGEKCQVSQFTDVVGRDPTKYPIEVKIAIEDGALILQTKNRHLWGKRWNLVTIGGERRLISVSASKSKNGEWSLNDPVTLYKMYLRDGLYLKSP